MNLPLRSIFFLIHFYLISGKKIQNCKTGKSTLEEQKNVSSMFKTEITLFLDMFLDIMWLDIMWLDMLP